MSNSGDFVIEDGVLTKYTGTGGTVIIPAGVTSIGGATFSECTSLTSIDLPAGLTTIGNAAFYRCTSLMRITIPAGVTAIGGMTFYGCHNLIGIDLPAGLTTVGSMSFCGCTSLTGIDLPSGLTSIGNWAFEYCQSLTSITIPAGVTSINGSTFKNCPAVLTAPHLPISSFAPANKPGAVCGFARLYLEHAELDETIRSGYLKYIRHQRKRLYPTAVQHEELLRLMSAEKIIPRKDISLLLDACDQQHNDTARNVVLEYLHRNFQPADPHKP